MLSTDDLNRLMNLSRLDRPWKASDVVAGVVDAGGDLVVSCRHPRAKQIAELHNAVPWLVVEIERLRAIVEELTLALETSSGFNRAGALPRYLGWLKDLRAKRAAEAAGEKDE